MKQHLTPVTLDTKLSNYLRVPREVFSLGLSGQALTVYAMLLERAFYSQKNKLVAQDGRVYCYYPRERIARDLGCSESSAANSMKRLTKCGLIEKVMVKNGLALRIFVYIPSYVYVPSDVYIPSAENNGGELSTSFTQQAVENSAFIRPDFWDAMAPRG